MMKQLKKDQVLLLLVLVIPLAVGYYLFQQSAGVQHHALFHYYYVILSSLIALSFTVIGYLEYRRNHSAPVFLIAIGFLGVAILYSFHALITPGYSFFTFPDIGSQINAFVFFGDASRFWLALLLFSPKLNISRITDRYNNVFLLVLIGVVLVAGSLLALLNPGFFPQVKGPDGQDTIVSILFKVITLVLLGIEILRYYDSYRIKPNVPLLSLVAGIILIAQTVVIFMISTPWTPLWWLAHNLFLLSYVCIGSGILYGYLRNQHFEYFDVLGQVKIYVDQLEEANKQLNVLASFDTLTGLYNRNSFFGLLGEQIETAEKDKSSFGVLYVDLDGFKNVNDTYGHVIGDAVLQATAYRIKGSVKGEDIVARLGGDEFIVLIPRIDRSHVALVAQRIIDAFREPIRVEGKSSPLGVSIGIALYPGDGQTEPELIRQSDRAMYEVKSAGKNSYAFAADLPENEQ